MTQEPGSRLETIAELWAGRIDRLPRLARVIVSLMITAELTVLLSVVVDQLLIEAVVEGDVGAMVPALIAAGIGLVFYVIGWWALVGFDVDPSEPWRAGWPTVLYVWAGIAGLAVLLVLVVYGLVFGYVL